jgi:hypothetical protein
MLYYQCSNVVYDVETQLAGRERMKITELKQTEHGELHFFWYTSHRNMVEKDVGTFTKGDNRKGSRGNDDKRG